MVFVVQFLVCFEREYIDSFSLDFASNQIGKLFYPEGLLVTTENVAEGFDGAGPE